MGSKNCDEAVLVDTMAKNWVDGAWMFMADYRVIMQTDCNVLSLDVSCSSRYDSVFYCMLYVMYTDS